MQLLELEPVERLAIGTWPVILLGDARFERRVALPELIEMSVQAHELSSGIMQGNGGQAGRSRTRENRHPNDMDVPLARRKPVAPVLCNPLRAVPARAIGRAC